MHSVPRGLVMGLLPVRLSFSAVIATRLVARNICSARWYSRGQNSPTSFCSLLHALMAALEASPPAILFSSLPSSPSKSRPCAMPVVARSMHANPARREFLARGLGSSRSLDAPPGPRPGAPILSSSSRSMSLTFEYS
ncbi:uncharacterized protein B0H18DRAFT_998777 [Fomitopsis serialis]|uniref:uncharacterized protein n=1 Tax=Fomitopsis serialis TaxID=139415 RepID=UPI0020075F12|nr:uncharacterized protein B0H18DRAFT_998777 [Neoantrodia serialis]KAH9929278.1 hypothetical protein B0H18DRAFT_998777 [Neoantrodia serialis]